MNAVFADDCHAYAPPGTGIPHARITLLAGASLVVLAALAAPGPARANCTGADQVISAPNSRARFQHGRQDHRLE